MSNAPQLPPMVPCHRIELNYEDDDIYYRETFLDVVGEGIWARSLYRKVPRKSEAMERDETVYTTAQVVEMVAARLAVRR